MIMANILCHGSTVDCHPDQLIVIPDFNKAEQIVPPVGCQCQTVVIVIIYNNNNNNLLIYISFLTCNDQKRITILKYT